MDAAEQFPADGAEDRFAEDRTASGEIDDVAVVEVWAYSDYQDYFGDFD